MQVIYTAGYAVVPVAIQQWMLLQIGQWHEQREAVAAGIQVTRMPFVDALLALSNPLAGPGVAMRAGQLNRRVVIKSCHGDPPGATVTTVWGGFFQRPPVAYRSPGAAFAGGDQCRMRYPDLLAGWYLVDGLQLFHVNHVPQPGQQGPRLAGVLYRTGGETGRLYPAGGDPVDTRCFVIHDAPFIGEHSQTVVYRARLGCR